MADTRTLTFNMTGRDVSAGRAFSSLSNDAERTAGHFSRLGSAMGSIGRGIATAGIVAGGAAIYGLGKVFHTGLGEVMDYQAGLSQLEAGLKSTGGVAGISAQGMEDLASKIQDYSGQTDDSIVKTEQLLLTFTNIRNEAGKGNDVFTQTTKIAADMAARMGGDASSAAIQLGKAMNDPIKGLTALTRVGVSFSEGQVAQVKAMVESGNTMGAQKLILAELNKEFGGSAKAMGETLPGKIQIAKRSFEDFAQSAVTAVLPAFTSMLSGLSTGMQKAQPYIASAIKGISDGLRVFVDFIQTQVIPRVVDFASALADRIGQVVPVVSAFITGQLMPAFREIGSFIAHNVLPVLQGLTEFLVGSVIPAIARTAGPVLDGLKQAFHSIAGAINAHREQLGSLFNALREVASFVVQKLGPVFGTYLKVQFQIAGRVIGAVIDVLGFIVGAGQAVARFFTGPFLRAIGNMTAAFLRAIGDMLDFFLKVSGGILHGAVLMMGWVPGLGGKLKRAEAAFQGFRSSVVAELGRAADAADALGERFKPIGYKAAHNFGVGFGSFDMYGTIYDSVHAAFAAAEAGARHKTESKSPSKVAIRIGEDFVGGFVIGVGKHAKHLYNVAAALAGGLADGFSYGLQQVVSSFGGRMQDVISRVEDTIAGARQGITDRMHEQTAAVRDAMHETLDAIKSTMHEQISAIKDNLRKTLDAIQATVDAVKSKLDELKSARDQMAASIAGSLSALNLGGLFTTDENGTSVMGNVTSYLMSKIAGLQRLAQDIAALRSAGLSGFVLNEIIGLPVDQATSVAEQIIGAMATNPNEIGNLNDLGQQVQDVSAGVGGTVAGANYDAQIAEQTEVLAAAREDAREARQEAHEDAQRQIEHARNHAERQREQAKQDADRQIEAIREEAQKDRNVLVRLIGALADLPKDANAKEIRDALLKLKNQIGALGLA